MNPKYTSSTLPLLAIILILSITACKEANKVEQAPTPVSQIVKTSSGEFTHAVYFWLKDPADQEKNTAFERSLEKFLSGSADIKTYHLGKPATTDRPIIDRSYTYALIVTFDSKAEHDAYQEDSAHKLFIKESEYLWERVQIYDSVNVL